MPSYKTIGLEDGFDESSKSLTAIQEKFKNPYTVYVAALSAFLHIVVMGLTVSFSAPAGVNMVKPESRIVATNDDISWIASLGAISSIIGASIAGYIADKLGRKTLLIYTSVPYLTSWLMVVYGSTMAWIFAGRFFSGLCVGLVSVVVPTYVVEISTPNIRGFLGAWFNMAFATGVLITMSLGAVLTWSWLAMSAAILIVFTVFLFAFMPESPHWSIVNTYYIDALNALKFLRKDNEIADLEFRILINQLHDKQEQKNTLNLQEFLKPEIYKPILLCIGLMLFQQICGINALMSYNVEIFQRSGSSLRPSVASILIASIQLFTTVICSTLMDRAGRKILFFISGALAFIGLTVLAISIRLTENNPTTSTVYGWVPIVGFILFIIAFNLGFGPIPWIMAPEMVPTHARSTVVGIVSVSAGLFMFVVVKSFDQMRLAIGDFGVFMIYAIGSLIGCFYCYFLPETKGKSLEEIQLYFKKKL